MANKVTITNTDNKVTITPQSNTISTSTTDTPITITQGTTSTVTVNTPGPQGEKGTFSLTTDIETRNITSSGNISSSGQITANSFGNISASGDISASSVHIAASAPRSLTINSGIHDNAVNIFSTDERVNISLSDSNTTDGNIIGVGVEGNDLILRSDIGGAKFLV